VLENTRQNNHIDYVFQEYDYVWSMSDIQTKSGWSLSVQIRKKNVFEWKNQWTNEVGSELSDCHRENTTVHQEREKLSEQLQNCESKECLKLNSDNSQSEFYETKNILLIVACGFVILLIAFLISISKNYQLSKDKKFLNAKLDKLCEYHVYEKVD
jgi:hypothetical protein